MAALALGIVVLTTIAFSGYPLKSNSPRSSLSTEGEFYYFGLPSSPVLVARTTTNRWKMPTGPRENWKRKQLRVPGRHPIDKVWKAGLALEIVSLMESTSVRWTGIDICRIGYTGELSFPLFLWVAVPPGSLSSDDGLLLATECKGILERYKIMDVDVEIRESAAPSLAGPELLRRPDSKDTTAHVAEPLTTTLGLPLCSRLTPWATGTGGCFLVKSSDPDTVLLLTARHVVFPDMKENKLFEQTNNTQPRHEVMLLSDSGFKKYLESIEAEINSKEYVAESLKSLLEKLAGAEDEKRQKRFRNTQESLDDTNKVIVRLKALYEDVSTRWATPENRVLGHVIYSPPIGFGVGSEGHTEDWAVIEMETSKINSTNFDGNMIDLGTQTSEFTKNMYPNIRKSSSSKYPGNGVLKLTGTIQDDEMHAPNAEDENGDPCLMVIKRGCSTGLTIGHASHIASYRRCYPDGLSGISEEWPIFSANPASVPFSSDGDSGSVIVDGQGRIRGLLTGGVGTSPVFDITYATPIGFLRERIEAAIGEVNFNPTLAS